MSKVLYYTKSRISIVDYAFLHILQNMGFRENLKTELSYSGMFVKELAAQTGLKKNTIDNYLSVRGRMPSAEAAVRIARVLGVSVEYLVTGNETIMNKGIVHLSNENRYLVNLAEKLKPEHRKVALLFMETLKNYEETQLKERRGM